MLVALAAQTAELLDLARNRAPDARERPLADASRPLRQSYPNDGWVEHDADEIWTAVQAVLREALSKSGVTAGDVAAIGITNQRETVVVWDRATGRPIHPAIV